MQTRIKLTQTRKRMNSSEPSSRSDLNNNTTSDFSKLCISQNVQSPINQDIEISIDKEQEQNQEEFDMELDLECEMGQSVISEYVLMDPVQLQSPQKSMKQHLDSIDLLDDIVIQDPKKIQGNKNIDSKQQKVNRFDDSNSNKTTSEINALINNREQQMKKPIYLNVIVIGESGLGKSTFIDAFLSKRFKKKQKVIRPCTQTIVENKACRSEGNVNFNINMIDTPGYNYQTNLKVWYKNIRDYITQKFEDQQKLEDKLYEQQDYYNQVEDDNFEDLKIHVCLYFLSGPRIKKEDISIMKKLQKYVNIIPILAKGDSFTPDEVREIKKTISNDAQKFNLKWFDIKKALKHNNEYIKRLQDGPHGPTPPFLMISSIKRIEVKPNIWVFGRNYKWGLCNIEDPDHSDFNLLYSLLIGHISLKLIDSTKFLKRQYFKEKSIQRRKYQSEEVNKMNKMIKGTLVTIGLGIASVLFYPIKHDNQL